jgi:co-chaperonin GroES (HSP10)
MGKVGNLRVLVRPVAESATEKKIGSIIVPVTVRHKMETIEAVVVEAGRGTPSIPMQVKVGDRVTVKDGDSRLKIGDCILLDQDDILQIL